MQILHRINQSIKTYIYIAPLKQRSQRRLKVHRGVCYQIPAPIRKLFCSKPESGVHVTEMMTYDWSMIITCVLMCFLVCNLLTNYEFIVYVATVASRSAVFIFGAKNALSAT